MFIHEKDHKRRTSDEALIAHYIDNTHALSLMINYFTRGKSQQEVKIHQECL